MGGGSGFLRRFEQQRWILIDLIRQSADVAHHLLGLVLEGGEFVDHFRREFPQAVTDAAQLLNSSSARTGSTYFYFCANTLSYSEEGRRSYNSALLIDPNGKRIGATKAGTFR